MRNKYDREDRILAFTMYQNKKYEIGLWAIEKIAQVTGHSVDSLKMKIDQFKGITGPRRKTYIEGDFGPGLNEWAAEDEQVWREFKNTDLEDLIFIAKKILVEKFKTFQESK